MNNMTNIRALSATTLNGTKVINRQGENLGHVEDMMIDLETGRIQYMVLSFGGILGIGDKLFAVPFESFTIDTDNDKLILDANRDFLENAPGFDKDDWPHTSKNDFRNEVYDYYSIQPWWTLHPTV